MKEKRTYSCTIKGVTDEFIERMNKYFDIESDDDSLVEETIGLFQFDFDDGRSITYDICCGQHNYYDNVVPFDKVENSLCERTCFDCEYELNRTMVFTYENNNVETTYICKLEE